MSFSGTMVSLLHDIGQGYMMSTAYDTAWVAQLTEIDETLGNSALQWLRQHQLDDGSWGASNPTYFHDRLICTLSATIALTKYGDQSDTLRVERAKTALATTIKQLATQTAIETIGFEMIVPTLWEEASHLNIIPNGNFLNHERLNRQRAAKLATLPRGLINRHVTLAFSSEMAGTDGRHLLEIEQLQEVNGSLGHSPSATAYFALHVQQNDPAAMHYLRQVGLPDGGIPNVAPFDLFERTWTLWNLNLLENLDSAVVDACQPHLDFLQEAWVTGKGVGFAAMYTPNDSDVTSVTYEVLSAYQRQPDFAAVLSYEEAAYFRCYDFESNPSISANIHVLGALRQAGFPADHASVQKIFRFLQSAQYWFDKWHVSPYYPTAHAIVIASGYIEELVQDAVQWITTTQQPSGAWGYYDTPTAEETAYCLQALAVWKRAGHDVNVDALKRGQSWLLEHAEPPYEPLWIGKCLYTPVWVVRSTILTAIELVSQVIS